VALGYAVFSDLPILPSAEGTVLAVAGGTVIGVGIVAYYVALTHTSVGIATTIIAMYFGSPCSSKVSSGPVVGIVPACRVRARCRRAVPDNDALSVVPAANPPKESGLAPITMISAWNERVILWSRQTHSHSVFGNGIRR